MFTSPVEAVTLANEPLRDESTTVLPKTLRGVPGDMLTVPAALAMLNFGAPPPPVIRLTVFVPATLDKSRCPLAPLDRSDPSELPRLSRSSKPVGVAPE